MNKQCECELPYIESGSPVCRQCGYNNVGLVLERMEEDYNVSMEYKGDEFKSGDIVSVHQKAYSCYVKILHWSKESGGFGYVQLPNGGLHYTRILGKTIKTN